MKEIIKVTDIKKDKNFMYYVKGNQIIKFNRRFRSEKIPILTIPDLEWDHNYLYFVSSNKEGLLTIERAKRDITRKAVKGLNWARTEEG